MLNDDKLQSPLCFEKTAHFFNPKLQKLRPLNLDNIKQPAFELPTFSRKKSQEEIAQFDKVVQNELSKYNSQPNILTMNWNLNNTSQLKPINPKQFFHFHKKQTSLISIQQKLICPQHSMSVNDQDTTVSPEKKRTIKVIPFPYKDRGQTTSQQQISRQSSNSSCSLSRPSKSQGKSFLQRKAQLKVLSRIFSSRSQHMLE